VSIARRSLSASRRSLLTAGAAGVLLAALWFVPSANATSANAAAESPGGTGSSPGTSVPAVRTDLAGQAHAVSVRSVPAADTRAAGLADTGSIDTTPYVVGGAMFLAFGAGLVVYSTRRERKDELPVA
jgi:LPXTG-motif cell wall-anchored protein